MNKDQPNIVFIMADHFRPDVIGQVTPNLTNLALTGATFENAYCASPLCQPSRVSVATGLFPCQTHICGNQADPVGPQVRNETYINHLKNAGYYTVLVGKHHFIDRFGLGLDLKDDAREIKKYGFDYVLQVADDGENIHNDDDYTEFLKRNNKLNEFRKEFWAAAKAFRHPFEEEFTAEYFIADQAGRFIENYDKDTPFYLNVGFIGPHPPYWHPGECEFTGNELGKPKNYIMDASTLEKRKHYLQRCRLIDKYVGQLIETLKRCGLYEKTVIIFTSDHGDNLGDYGIWDKRYFYEQSVKVPLILAGPGIAGQQRMNGPRKSKALVSLLDIYPTILSLAQIRPKTEFKRYGLDITRTLGYEKNTARQSIHNQLGTCVMVRDSNWKLVYDLQQQGVQYLLNLAVDPCETENLAGNPSYDSISLKLVSDILNVYIDLFQYTHIKEEQRLQRVCAF